MTALISTYNPMPIVSRHVLLSIQPKYADQIYDGSKTLEWRKSFPDKRLAAFDSKTAAVQMPVSLIVYLYETRPIRMVTGCIKVTSGFRFLSADSIPEKQLAAGQVPLAWLTQYAKGKSLFGWEVTRAKLLDLRPVTDFCHPDGKPIEGPPQSWCFVEKPSGSDPSV